MGGQAAQPDCFPCSRTAHDKNVLGGRPQLEATRSRHQAWER